jgi:hypothetical protein
MRHRTTDKRETAPQRNHARQVRGIAIPTERSALQTPDIAQLLLCDGSLHENAGPTGMPARHQGAPVRGSTMDQPRWRTTMTSTRPRGPTNLEASQPVMLTTMEPNSAGQKPAMLNPSRSKATDPSIQH